MKNILFVDVDGTLTGFKNGSQYTPQSAITALQSSKAKGNLNVICTGRSLFELNTIGNIQEMGFDAIIGANGGYIEYKQKEIYHKVINKEDVDSIMKYFDSIDLGYYLECNEGLFWSKALKELMYKNRTPEQIEASQFLKIFRPLEECHYLVNKISFRCSLEQLDIIENKYGEQYGLVKTSYGDGKGGELFNKGVTKYSAITYLLDYLNINEIHTYGFGDSMNDREMFLACDTKIAMGNARDNLKEDANYVTDSLDQDGLAKAIHYYHLDQEGS